MGWATITHPFHPLHGQRFEVLKTRRVAGIDTLILRHAERGSYAVAQEWTDWGLPNGSTGLGGSMQKLAVEPLLQLTDLLTGLTERAREELDQ